MTEMNVNAVQKQIADDVKEMNKDLATSIEYRNNGDTANADKYAQKAKDAFSSMQNTLKNAVANTTKGTAAYETFTKALTDLGSTPSLSNAFHAIQDLSGTTPPQGNDPTQPSVPTFDTSAIQQLEKELQQGGGNTLSPNPPSKDT